MSWETNRREFLRGAMATTAFLMAARTRALALEPQRQFAPVKVSRDRVIREVVGLRPYRDEGFVVEAQRAGSKFLIHNYGHGGGGMTLSWGTATLAIDLAREALASVPSLPRRAEPSVNRRFAVLGCGVSGLSTARLLQGKISLDANINDKLVSWKLPDNEFTAKKPVTLRSLLSHTAGTTVHGFPGYAITEKLPTLPQVLDGAAPANTAPVRVDLEPGTQFRYSGGGTTITQLALTEIEKKPYPEIASETVLKPLNMTNSTYSQPLPRDWRPKAATGYHINGKEAEGKIHVYPEMAAAGLWTTPTDLAKFAIEMQLSLAGRSNKILTKQSVETMTTAVLDNVGLGFFIEKHGNAVYFGHSGSDEGFTAELLVSRDKGYGVAVMVNSDSGGILREVIRAVAREYGWDEFLPAPYEVISIDAARLDAYTGRFLVNPDRVLTIKAQAASGSNAARLRAYPTADQEFELLPITDTTFIRRGAGTKYEFVTTPEPAAANDARRIANSIRIILVAGGTATAGRISESQLVPYEMLLAGKVSEATEAYRKIRTQTPNNASVAENRLNDLAYRLMQQKKLSEAIALFKLNVEFYPKSANAYDSLGEAFMTNGEKELAIVNYRKALELNPNNSGAREMLKKLQDR